MGPIIRPTGLLWIMHMRLLMIVGTLGFDILNTCSIDSKGCCEANYQPRLHTASNTAFDQS